MSGSRVVLLDASLGETPAERNFQREVDADVDAFKVSEGELPPTPTEGWRTAWPYDGVIVSGSQASVYEDAAWIRDVEAWVRQAVTASVPLLGVCWGHQLVASALGGAVGPIGRYEIGYRTVDVVASDPLFDGIPESFVAFETHSDEIKRLPDAAVPLAENDCTIQAFRIGSAYGVQFHPEYDLQTARWILDGKDLQPERAAAIREELTEERYEQARVATRVFENFLAIVDDATSESHGLT